MKEIVIKKAIIECPKKRNLQKICFCRECTAYFHGFGLNTERKFIANCNYTKGISKEKIVIIVRDRIKRILCWFNMHKFIYECILEMGREKRIRYKLFHCKWCNLSIGKEIKVSK